MKNMSTPGWYPDPRDDGQERFWNGTEWTEQVRPAETPPGAGTHSVVVPPTPRRSNTVLWGVLTLILAMIGGGGGESAADVEQVHALSQVGEQVSRRVLGGATGVAGQDRRTVAVGVSMSGP